MVNLVMLEVIPTNLERREITTDSRRFTSLRISGMLIRQGVSGEHSKTRD